MAGQPGCLTAAAQAYALLEGHAAPETPAREPSGALSTNAWEHAFPSLARGPALDIWRCARDAAATLYAPALASLGVAEGNRPSAKARPPAADAIEKIAQALAVEGLELYESRSRPEICLACGRSLVVGSACSPPLPPPARFRVAYQLALLRDGLGPLVAIADAELELFFAACARVAGTKLSTSAKLAENRIEDCSNR